MDFSPTIILIVLLIAEAWSVPIKKPSRGLFKSTTTTLSPAGSEYSSHVTVPPPEMHQRLHHAYPVMDLQSLSPEPDTSGPPPQHREHRPFMFQKPHDAPADDNIRRPPMHQLLPPSPPPLHLLDNTSDDYAYRWLAYEK